MDRRTALRQIGLASTGVTSAVLISSSPAFAGGGSGDCRSTPAISNTLTVANMDGISGGNNKDVVRVLSSTTSFSAAACACAWTSSVQRRWTVTEALGTATGIYSDRTAGTLLSGGFGTEASTVTVPATVYLRHVAGGNLTGIYTVDLTIRHICRSGGSFTWSCQRYRNVFEYSTAGGGNGTVIPISSGSFGPPDNSSFCDSPAPV